MDQRRAQLPDLDELPAAVTNNITKELEKAANLKIKLDTRGLAITKEMRTAQEKLNDRLKDLNKLMAAGSISQETMSRASEKAVEDYKKSVDTVKTSLIDMKAVAEEVARSMQGNFSDFFFNLGSEVNSFQSLWQSTLNTVRRAVADFASQKTIGLLKNLFTGGGTAAGSTPQGNALTKNFTKSTKQMFETFRNDKAEMDRHFEDNLRGLGVVVDNTARGMSLDFENSFFSPTSQRLDSFANRFKAVIGSLRDSIGGLTGALGGGGGGGGGEGIGFNMETGMKIAQIALMFADKGGEVSKLPTKQFPLMPNFDTGGHVGAVLRKDEFVVSPGGTKAAGIDRLNRINRGDLSDFGGGRGGVNITVLAPIIQNNIDTQSGVEFLMRPENSEAIEAHLENALMGNGRIRDALESARK